MQPLVTVVTPTYNHAGYIGRCIESLLAQSYRNWEHIIVDDGSTDDTRQVIAHYKDPRIRYVFQENRGVRALASTINAGVQRGRGELVTMFGSDDTWPPHRLEAQVPAFEDPRVVLAFGRGRLINENDEVLAETTLPKNLPAVLNRPLGSILHALLVDPWLPQYTVLIRRSALDRIGGYLQPPGLLAEDYPTHLALALEGEFRFIDRFLGNYRMHAHQQTRNVRLEMYRTDVEYVRVFFRGLPPAMKAASGWTEETLERELQRILKNAYFSEGRRTLLRGDRRLAARQFARAFREGTIETKAKALAGLSCTITGMDLEKLARRFGYLPLR